MKTYSKWLVLSDMLLTLAAFPTTRARVEGCITPE